MNMANMFGTTERKNSQHLRFEEFVPSSGLTEDSDSYCLIIDLPGNYPILHLSQVFKLFFMFDFCDSFLDNFVFNTSFPPLGC